MASGFLFKRVIAFLTELLDHVGSIIALFAIFPSGPELPVVARVTESVYVIEIEPRCCKADSPKMRSMEQSLSLGTVPSTADALPIGPLANHLVEDTLNFLRARSFLFSLCSFLPSGAPTERNRRRLYSSASHWLVISFCFLIRLPKAHLLTRTKFDSNQWRRRQSAEQNSCHQRLCLNRTLQRLQPLADSFVALVISLRWLVFESDMTQLDAS